MYILSPSILAADFARLGEQIKEIEKNPGADYIHFDVMDGMFVPNLSFGIPVLKSLRKVTDKVLDVHLMIEAPERYIDNFVHAGADVITFHIEACKHPKEVIESIHLRGKKAGIAIKPGTPVDELRPFFGLADMFLVMTVEPGFGGQSYMDICTDKIKLLKKMLERDGFDTDIQVDGGITKDNVDVVLDAGANVIVMGSSIFKGDIAENVKYFEERFSKY